MLLVSTDFVTGYRLKTLSIVKGNVIFKKSFGKDVAASFRTFVNGEMKEYAGIMEEARTLAAERMTAEAEKLGADAVVNVRYETASIMQGAIEVLIYGTAVKYI